MKTNHKTNKSKGLQSRPELLCTADRPQIDLALRRANRALGTEQLLELLRSSAPRFYELAEVIGQWVWITFPDKQSVEVTTALSQFGFHWNRLRQAWQHPGGTIPTDRKNYDPRKRYGTRFASDLKAA